jgi:hypothetical protein
MPIQEPDYVCETCGGQQTIQGPFNFGLVVDPVDPGNLNFFNLAEHMAQAHPEKFVCCREHTTHPGRYCGQCFDDQSSLDAHLTNDHPPADI